MSNPTPVTKYRPVLTASQITHIAKLCRADSSAMSLSVLAAMSLYEYKIKEGIIEPAYSEQPKQSLTDSLGFGSEDLEVNERGNIQLKTHDDESLYQQWLISPDGMSVDQLKRVQFYRYNNGKMTPDQEREYESETLGV